MFRRVLAVAIAPLFLLTTAAVFGQTTPQRSFEDLVAIAEDARHTGAFPALLKRAAEQAPTIRDLLNLMDRHVAALEEAEDRELAAELLSLAAHALETGNRYSEAGRMYRRAFAATPDNYTLLLAAASMDLETGRTAQALADLTTVVERGSPVAVQRQAAALRVRALLLEDQGDRALEHARSLVGSHASAGMWLLLWDVAREHQSTADRERAERTLRERFPDAPETALLPPPAGESSRITFFPGPGRLLTGGAPPSREPEPTAGEPPDMREPRETAPPAAGDPGNPGLQTGSFRDAENARYMVSDLAEAGIMAVVSPTETDHGRFYRVIIPLDPREEDGQRRAEELVIRLKEMGVEGFRVFQ